MLLFQIEPPVDAPPPQPHGFMGWVEQPHVKWALPIPILLALAPLVWLFFRKTWRELEEEALAYRKALHDAGKIDFRPLVALALGAFVLVAQDYSTSPLGFTGHGSVFDTVIRPWLVKREMAHPNGWTSLLKYEELYRLTWWAVTRMGGYLVPLVVWRLFFPRDAILDFGLRTRGFLEHAWIYAMFVTVMIPLMMIVARQPDFGTYYPFYRNSSRSWQDFAMWEVLYVGQFFTLEIFFRGWWVRACRSFGVGAIFCMVVPYAMIHIGKPYLEACGAIVAGTVLGSLSMRTRSIYAGFFVHITVAILMDLLALRNRAGLPTVLRPDKIEMTSWLEFRLAWWAAHLNWILWGVWALATIVFVVKVVRSRVQIAEAVRRLLRRPLETP